jgi:hypothetical protein
MRESPEGANEVLGRIFQNVIGNLYRELPTISQRVVQDHIGMQSAAARFMQENEDLSAPAMMKLVGIVANEVRSNKPELANDPYSVFTEAGKEVRKRLKLQKNKKSKKKASKSAGLPKPRSQSRSSGSQRRNNTQGLSDQQVRMRELMTVKRKDR